MKKRTIDALAAKYHLYAEQNIPETHRGLYLRKPEEPIRTFAGVESDLFFECRTEGDGTPYCKSAYVLYLPEGGDTLLTTERAAWNKPGMIRFIPLYHELRQYHNITNSLQKEAIQRVEQPNYMGVFTAKKVADHIEYCRKVMEALRELRNTIDRKNRENSMYVDDYIRKMKKVGAKISEYHDRRIVQTELFEVVFTLDYERGQMTVKSMFRGDEKSVLRITDKMFNKSRTAKAQAVFSAIGRYFAIETAPEAAEIYKKLQKMAKINAFAMDVDDSLADVFDGWSAVTLLKYVDSDIFSYLSKQAGGQSG